MYVSGLIRWPRKGIIVVFLSTSNGHILYVFCACNILNLLYHVILSHNVSTFNLNGAVWEVLGYCNKKQTS